MYPTFSDIDSTMRRSSDFAIPDWFGSVLMWILKHWMAFGGFNCGSGVEVGYGKRVERTYVCLGRGCVGQWLTM